MRQSDTARHVNNFARATWSLTCNMNNFWQLSFLLMISWEAKHKKVPKKHEDEICRKNVSRKKFLEFRKNNTCKISAKSYGPIRKSLLGWWNPDSCKWSLYNMLGPGSLPGLAVFVGCARDHPVEAGTKHQRRLRARIVRLVNEFVAVTFETFCTFFFTDQCWWGKKT